MGGRGRIEYTNKDYESLRSALLALARERLPEWTDHSENDPGVVLLELFAALGDALFYHQDRIAAESYLATAAERRSVLHLLRLIGYELRPPVPASADLTLYFERTDLKTPIVIDHGAVFATASGAAGEALRFAYLRPPLTIDLGELALEVVLGKELAVYDRLPVVQFDHAVLDEAVASSDGSAFQRFKLAHAPLIDAGLVVRVVEPTGVSVVWSRQVDLWRSSAVDKHYAIHVDENDAAWIEFGNGTNGQIPPRGRNNVRVSYYVGGGPRGNVSAGAITKAITVTDSRLTRVTNPRAASGGAEHEALDDAAERGPRQFRSMGRAVTADDFELHAKSFGVAKARALSAGWSRVELYVAPEGGGYASDTLKEDLRLYFADKRMMTTQIEIKDPTYRQVYIEAEVDIEPRHLRREVERRVRDAMRLLWSFDRVDFGATLYISKIYEALESVPGVRGVNVVRFATDDGNSALPGDGRLRFKPTEVPSCPGFAEKGLTLTGGAGG